MITCIWCSIIKMLRSNSSRILPMKCISPGCMEMIKEGKQPACVQACPAEARLFGDILDPQSEISQKIASSRTELLMPNKGTKPNFFVVVSK